MAEQLPSDQCDTPKTDEQLQIRVDAMGNEHYVVPAEFARDQERTIASHVDLMARLKDHMERMGFCTREEEPYLEELDEAIQKAQQL